jgi:CRISPR-associated protein Cmr2
MPYLFLVSIGPVQGFIASARRTRDLAFGSWLLSELAKAAAQKIAEMNGIESLIFPAPQNIKELQPATPLNVANKIVAIIHLSPQDMEKKVRDTINTRLETLKNWAYTGIQKQDYYEQVAQSQVDDLVEYSWVAVPYDGNNYEEKRKILEALLDARKNTRDFLQVEWGNNIPKSSIDGQLESVIPENKYPGKNASDEDKAKKIKYLYDKYGAGPAERLSGVDILKRKGSFQSAASGFPSTSHMAAISFLQRLKAMNASQKAAIQKKWNEYINAINNIPGSHIEEVPTKYAAGADAIIGDCDGSLLFGERLVDMVDTGYNKESMAAKLKPAQLALQNFFAEVKVHPNPYYAILRADGDRMGRVIDNQAKHGEKQHQALSKALNTFAGSVRRIVEEKYQGALAYAGGDDVLALMPLHTVLQCAKELADNFRKELNGFKDDKGNPPTLSAGIVIVHHLYFLQDALRLARDAEDRAKKVFGEDALAITISKRSGDDYTIVDKWDNLYSHLEHLIDYFYSGAIPEGTAYELRDMALRLEVPNVHPDYSTVQEVILADAKRILERKMRFAEQNQKKDSKQTKNILDLLKDRLGIAQEHDESTETITVDVAIDQFINELIIAHTLANVKKLTEPKKEQSNGNLAH